MKESIFILLFIHLIEQVEYSQLLAYVDLLYFHSGQLFSNSVWVLGFNPVTGRFADGQFANALGRFANVR